MNKHGDRLDELFKELVPASGKAPTVAGEIVRAACKIGYRYNNDGDIINSGYGKETCNPPARYLAENTNEEIAKIIDYIFETFQGASYGNMGYECMLEKLFEKIIEYLDEHQELTETENTEDMWDYFDEDDNNWYEDEEEDDWDDWGDDEEYDEDEEDEE